MYKIIIFLFLSGIVACSEKNAKLSKEALDDLMWQMTDKAHEYMLLPSTDSLRIYLSGLEHSVKRLDYDRLSFYWNMTKVQLSLLDKKQDSVSFYIDKTLAYSKLPGITEIDLLNFYVIYEELLVGQNLLDSALQVSYEAYFIAKRSAPLRLATTAYNLAKIYGHLDDLPNMRKYMFEAWQHSDAEPDMKGLTANVITYYYNRTGEIDSATYYLKEFQKDSLIVSQPQTLGLLYENTAVLLHQQDSLEEGLVYQLKAKSIWDELGSRDPVRYINLGETYGRLKLYNKGIKMLDSAILLAKQRYDYLLVKSAWKNKAVNYNNRGDYQNAYYALDSAYTYYGIEMDSSLRETARELEKQYEVKEKDDQIQNLAIQNEANKKIKLQQQFIIITLCVVMLLLGALAASLWKRRRIRHQLKEAQLQQQLLRSQMEPHFVFNSLSVLQSFIRSDDKDKSIGYLGEFSKLLRQTLENARGNLVPVKKEVETLESYLHLQVINFDHQFDYTFTVYDGWQKDKVTIPPMLLQPFVENAILHGFAGIDYKGKMAIDIQKESGLLRCVIDDNGSGLTAASDKTNRSLSTQITKERLSILSSQTGSKGSLTIIDKRRAREGKGVRVILEIPYQSFPV